VGVEEWSKAVPRGTTPHPNPPPQGGRESQRHSVSLAQMGAALVAARRPTACGSAGGHKARPYAMHFPFNFEEAYD